jgi:hypothetical protein
MFVNAIEEIFGYTRSIHSLFRNYKDPTESLCKTILFFVNETEVIVTCAQLGIIKDNLKKHQAELYAE